MKFKAEIFFKEALFFALTLFLGILSANHYLVESSPGLVGSVSFSWSDILAYIIVIVIFYFIFSKFNALISWLLNFFLIIVVLVGTQIIFGIWFGDLWSWLLSLIILTIFVVHKTVLSHDVAMVLGIAGISSILGISLSPTVALLLLVVMSFYDILAVYWTRHMVYMAQGMIEAGAVFGFIIPSNFRGFLYNGQEAKKEIGTNFMILGSGDIGLPLIMASSVATQSLTQAFIVAMFSIIGVFVTHLIFINQSHRKPMAALPPIATLTIIGYLFASILF